MDYEKLFYKALNKILDNNGGSLTEALYGIAADEEEEQFIRKEYGWDEE